MTSPRVPMCTTFGSTRFQASSFDSLSHLRAPVSHSVLVLSLLSLGAATSGSSAVERHNFCKLGQLAFCPGSGSMMKTHLVRKAASGLSWLQLRAPCFRSECGALRMQQSEQNHSLGSSFSKSKRTSAPGCSQHVRSIAARLYPSTRTALNHRYVTTLRGGAPSQDDGEEWMDSGNLQTELNEIVSEMSTRVEQRGESAEFDDWSRLADRVEALSKQSIRHYRAALEQQERDHERQRVSESGASDEPERGLFIL